MKIQVTSDNHLEFRTAKHKFFNKLEVNADILVIAGDLATISCIRGALMQACEKFKHVLFVAGNHEFYGTSFPKMRALLREFEESLSNFHFLNRNIVEIEGQRFIGCTMWFKMNSVAESLSHNLNDFYQIQDFRDHIREEHEADCIFLAREMQEGDVVITHHSPSELSADERYKGDPMNCFYVTDREGLIKSVKPRLWVHGHMHSSADYKIGSTQVVCNPGGYFPNHMNPNYSAKAIEL